MPYGQGYGKGKKKVTAENTRKSTDYRKKAEKEYAGPGTKLAPAGSKMRKAQDMQAKKRIASGDAKKYNERTRGQNIDTRAMEMERNSFRNSDQKKFKTKGFFGRK